MHINTHGKLPCELWTIFSLVKELPAVFSIKLLYSRLLFCMSILNEIVSKILIKDNYLEVSP